MATLDRPRELTVRQLYALSMNRCAFPGCTTALVTPGTGTVVGEVCHIRAQSPKGPRYSAEQDDEERHGFDNLILMCRNHHKQIDDTASLATYTVNWLFSAKTTHENSARVAGPIETPREVVTALALTTVSYERGSTHMDFRNAVFRVGGEGGGLLGAGGQGGVLTIVGISRLPDEVTSEVEIDLKGGDGHAPGGGGGVLIFEGRPATAGDVASGLKVPFFFPANSATVADGLLYVLGAGWECCWVSDFAQITAVHLAFMVDFGMVEVDVLFNFEFVLVSPTDVELTLTTRDIAVPERTGTINTAAQSAVVATQFDAPGIYKLLIQSGNTRFAEYSFEVRLRTDSP